MRATDEAHSRISKAFNDPNLPSYSLRKLKSLLIDFAELREDEISNVKLIAILPKRKETLEKLIELKKFESESKHTNIRSYIAIGISILALLVNGFTAWDKSSKGALKDDAKLVKPVDADNQITRPSNSKKQLDD
jgi:hypothetical protein